MPQPQGTAEWATDELYSSPGDPWDGNPTKVNPPSGKIAEGWEPTEELAAQFLNDWQNRAGALLQHLRFMQPANWELVRDISPTTPQEFRDIGYDPSTGIYIVTGDDAATATFRSRDGGDTWTAPTTPPIALPDGNGVESDGAGNWVVVADSPSISESADDGDTWTTRTMGAVNEVGNDVKYDPISALWVVAGADDTAGGRRLWTSPDRSTWTVRISVGGATTSLFALWVNAAGFGIALGESANFYTSPDMITWTLRSVAGMSEVTDVVYSEGAEMWFAIARLSGSGTRVVLTSADGITFTQPAGQTGVPNVSTRSISCDQGELVAIATAGNAIAVSTDRALTWTTVAGIGGSILLPRGPLESGGTPTGSADVQENLNFLAGRFITVGNSGNLYRTPSMV